MGEQWIERVERTPSVWPRRIATGGLLALSFLIVVLAFYPGLNNADSNQTVYQAMTHFALDWWTPFGSLVLREWFALGLGLGPAWLVQTAIFVGGTWLLLRFVLPAPWAAAGTLLVVGWPPTYGQLSSISRDVFFMGFGLLALGALGAAYRVAGENRRRRWAWLVLALVSAMASYLSRQNGIVIVIGVVLAALPLLIPKRLAALSRWRRVAGAVLIAGATGVVAFGCAIAMDKVFDVTPVHAERFIYLDDLASISKLTGHDQFPARLIRHHTPGWVTPYVDQRTIEAEFDWINSISLYPNNLAGTIAFADPVIAKKEADILRRAWLRSVEHHPADYLWGRIRLTASILGLTRHPVDSYLGLADPTNFGRPIEFYHGQRAAQDVLTDFVGPNATIPLEIQWPYLLLSVFLTIFLWRRWPADRPLLLAITIAIWANLVVDFFFAPASSYRYADLNVPLTIILALWAIATLGAQRAAPSPPPAAEAP